MSTSYQLFGTGIPWGGKPISRSAALGLIRSFKSCPKAVVQSCSWRDRASRVWVLCPRDAKAGGCFNVVATHSREVSL